MWTQMTSGQDSSDNSRRDSSVYSAKLRVLAAVSKVLHHVARVPSLRALPTHLSLAPSTPAHSSLYCFSNKPGVHLPRTIYSLFLECSVPLIYHGRFPHSKCLLNSDVLKEPSLTTYLQ